MYKKRIRDFLQNSRQPVLVYICVRAYYPFSLLTVGFANWSDWFAKNIAICNCNNIRKSKIGDMLLYQTDINLLGKKCMMIYLTRITCHVVTTVLKFNHEEN